jgi:glucose-1-phosphate thymidylyltransferase
MKVIIPVAGEGKRLRPHTYTKPKQLLPVAGKPAVDHIMDNFMPLKPTAYYFVVGHLKQQIEKYMRHKYPKLDIKFIEQSGVYGTATAVYCAREAFNEDVLIDFGDTLFDTDLSIIKHCKDDGIIWAMHREDFQRFGVIVTDEHGYMKKIVEKPLQPVSKLANIGMYYIKNTKLLQEGIEHTLKHVKPDEEAWLTYAFQYMIDHGAKIKVAQCQQWFDCGTPEALLDANKTLLERVPQRHKTTAEAVIIPPVAIHPSANIENSTIGPYVSIGPGAHVINSTLRNSILDEGSQVEDAILTDSVIGVEAVVKGNASKVIIGDHSRVEGLSPLAPIKSEHLHARPHKKKATPTPRSKRKVLVRR